MKDRNVITSKLGTLIFILVVIFILSQLYGVYKTYYYNEFIKAENVRGISKFRRDKTVKYSDDNSYRIESKEYNDAVFYKEVKVKPNTPYRVRCMVKTEKVENELGKTNSGAQICIIGTTECSESISGTTDWQQIELMFNSKNRETMTIGFRLGGNKGNSKGTAWFSDFILDEGYKDESGNWNMACFIFKNVNVEVNTEEGLEQLSISMSEKDIESISETAERFKDACKELSENRMSVNYDIYEITDPITSISYSEEFGYYIDPMDVKDQITEYLRDKSYHHIFIIVRLGDIEREIEIPVNDWIGLGGMDLYDIGFSNIRLPNDRNSYIYTYDYNVNRFPEEVMLHEFLHSLERIMLEHGYDIPALHDYKDYGYEEEKVVGLKKWYGDYMTKKVWNSDTNEYVGLDPIVYTLKPVTRDEFEFAVEIKFNVEPKNIFQEINSVFKTITRVFTKQTI